jgi:hypothetical protein
MKKSEWESKKIEKGKEVTWEAMGHCNGNKASIPTPLHRAIQIQ